MLSFGFDREGDWAIIDCDAPGCPAHVVVQVLEEGRAPEIAMEEAQAAGWIMTDLGQDRCDLHAAGAGQGPPGGRAA